MIKHKGVELRPIPGYPGYFAGEDGSLWSQRGNGKGERWRNPMKRLMPRKHPRYPYLRVNLCVGEQKKQTIRVAQLIAWTWLGEQASHLKVCHRDGDHSNNSVANLYYGTHVENMLDLAWHNKHGVGTIRPEVDPDNPETYAGDENVILHAYEPDPELGF